MKSKSIIYIDVDDSETPCYNYRAPHFEIARKRGFLCLTIARSTHRFVSRLKNESDEVILVEDLEERIIHDVVVKLSSRLKVDAIFSYAGQAGPGGQIGIVVANVCKKLGLHHASATGVNACNDKFSMRKKLHEHGVKSIRFALCQNKKQLAADAAIIGYPLIAKPRFGARSAFIKKCATEQELFEHYEFYQKHFNGVLSRDSFGPSGLIEDENNFPGKTIMLEEWIEGTEGSVECVITKDAVFPLIINEKLILTNRSGTILEDLLITPPNSFSLSEQKTIRDYASDCIRAVGLDVAIAHFEFKMTSAGPRVIEINPRLGGLYVSSAFLDIAKINPWETYLDLLLDTSSIDKTLSQASRRVKRNTESYSMIAIYPQRSGLYKGMPDISVLNENRKILEHEQLQLGTVVNSDAEEHYLLKCWAKVSDATDARSLYETVISQVHPVIEQDDDEYR